MVIRYSLLLGALVLTLGWGDAARAGHAAYPHPCPNSDVCIPNAGAFGYFPTTWRQWPGEKRLEVTNPKAVGLETLPTPEGQEYIPAPAAPIETPFGGPEGELLPPGGTILPPQEPGPLHELPAEPQTPAEGGLPGLPVEPDSNVLPDLPETGKPAEQPESPSSGTGRGMEWESRKRATAAIPFEMRKPQPRNTVVLLIEDQPLEESRVEPTSHYADIIVATESDASAENDVEAAAYAMVESAASAEVDSDVKMGAPPVALGGYCPVDLIQNGRWTQGDLRYTIVHDGWIFRLSGTDQWQQFQSNPDAFTPVCSGNDPVLSADHQRSVPGQITYCAVYKGHLYMFSSAASQSRFNEDPQRYAAEK